MKTSTGALVVAFCLPSLLAAAEEKSPPPRTHVLFMGADLSVQYDQKIYKVEDVTGSELKIHVDQQEVDVPTRRGPVSLQVNAGLKLAGVSVQLDQLESGPAYTYGNDPMRKLEQASNSAMDVAHAQDMAAAQVGRDAEYVVNAQRAYDNSSRPEEKAANLAALQAGQARQVVDANQAQAGGLTSIGELTNVGEGAHRMKNAEGNYDAMEVSFKVSSPVELDHPFMVILFKFHEPSAKPGTDGLVIHAQTLDPIGAVPHYVRVLKGGLPVGFKFVDCTVHIYNRGTEVATNLSSKRVEMTHAETQQYVVMEHIGAHKGATLPAAAVIDSLPRAQRQALLPEQLKRRLYVKVSKDGLLLGAYTDEACTMPLDEATATTALSEVLFTPALQQGKPVEGVARLRLGDI